MTRSLGRGQFALLGLAMLGALGIAGWMLLATAQRQSWGHDAVEVASAFQDVGGLSVGTRVHLQGVDVGEVTAVDLPDIAGQPVQVRMRLAGHLRQRLGGDTKVKIARDNPLGDRIVRLMPGQPNAPRLGENTTLAAAEMPDLFDGLAQATSKLNHLMKELDGAVQSLRSDGQTFTTDVAQSAQKLNQVLSKLDRTLAKVEAGQGTLGKLVQDDKLYDELTSAVRELKGAAYDIRNGDGTIGQLVKDKAAYDQTLNAIQDLRSLVASVKQNSDAMKSLPVVRSYVVDTNKELVRPDAQRSRKVFAESDLFEPGKAMLTDKGKETLAKVADWANENKEAEVVIAGIAAPKTESSFAQTLTQKQAEAVREQLLRSRVHRTGWWWWSSRDIRAFGCGNQAPAQPESENLPPARIEVILFSKSKG